MSTRSLTLRAVETFIAIVETGSMAGAAKRLGTTPSAVSQQINNLEQVFGVQLFDRHLRPIGLTPAGTLLQDHALKIADAVESAKGALIDMHLSRIPRLRLAVIDSLDATITPKLVSGLGDEFEGCHVVAWSGRSEEHRIALENRAVDLIITTDPLDSDARIERHAILREPMVLITKKGALADGNNIRAALDDRPFVRYSPRSPLGREIERHLMRLRLTPPHRYEFDSSRSIFALVAETDGWAVTTPLCYMDSIGFHDEIDCHPLPFAGLTRTISLLSREGELGHMPARLAHRCRLLLRDSVLPSLKEMLPFASPQVIAPAPLDPTVKMPAVPGAMVEDASVPPPTE